MSQRWERCTLIGAQRERTSHEPDPVLGDNFSKAVTDQATPPACRRGSESPEAAREPRVRIVNALRIDLPC